MSDITFGILEEKMGYRPATLMINSHAEDAPEFSHGFDASGRSLREAAVEEIQREVDDVEPFIDQPFLINAPGEVVEGFLRRDGGELEFEIERISNS